MLETVLRAGDPVEKVDAYRTILERNGLSLTSASHMRQLIPILAKRLKEQDKASVASKFCSIVFDGTDHFGELLLVFARIWDGDDWEQLLIRLRHSEHALDTRSLAFLLDRACICVGIDPAYVLGFVKDSVAVNFSAIAKLQSEQNYKSALSLPCWPHIISRLGKKLKLLIAISFIKTWSSYFKKSLKVNRHTFIPLLYFY